MILYERTQNERCCCPSFLFPLTKFTTLPVGKIKILVHTCNVRRHSPGDHCFSPNSVYLAEQHRQIYETSIIILQRVCPKLNDLLCAVEKLSPWSSWWPYRLPPWLLSLLTTGLGCCCIYISCCVLSGYLLFLTSVFQDCLLFIHYLTVIKEGPASGFCLGTSLCSCTHSPFLYSIRK